jgi:branched-subunit amino acid aminotransferase/4-amino-4-deoxychorismate lyase
MKNILHGVTRYASVSLATNLVIALKNVRSTLDDVRNAKRPFSLSTTKRIPPYRNKSTTR